MTNGADNPRTDRRRSRRAGWRRLLPDHLPIAYKFSLAIALLITAGMTVLGLVILDNQTNLLRQHIRALGSTVATQMAASAKEPILAEDNLSLEVLAANLANEPAVLGVAILSRDGSKLTQAGQPLLSDAAPMAGKLAELVKEQPRTIRWLQTGEADSVANGTAFIKPIIFKDLIAGYVVADLNHAAIDRSITESTKAIVLATVVMILIGVAISFLIGRRLSQPINDLVHASRAAGSGNYQYRFLERRSDEIGHLMASFNELSAGLMEKQQVESALSRYLSDNVARQVLSDLDQIQLGGHRTYGTVLFADIVGFTQIAESMQPQAIADLLNQYFGYIAEAGKRYNGTVDKYMGDCAMLVFGVPDPDPEHAFNAVACARLIQRTVSILNDQRRISDLPAIQFRIGINTGDMLAGNMGSRDRMQYTVVGDAVNLASRLCSVAEGGEIIISQSVRADPAAKSQILTTRHKSISLRGVSRAQKTYRVDRLRRPQERRIKRQALEILQPLGDMESCDVG